jgi:hypothetical protein
MLHGTVRFLNRAPRALRRETGALYIMVKYKPHLWEENGICYYINIFGGKVGGGGGSTIQALHGRYEKTHGLFIPIIRAAILHECRYTAVAVCPLAVGPVHKCVLYDVGL